MEITELRAKLEELHSSSFGWALSCCRHDAAEAEEVLQLVYLKILEGKALFGGEASFKTWLFAVIRKTAASERRKNLLRFLKFHNSADVNIPALGNQPSVEFEKSETQRRFKKALALLPTRQREILFLVFYHELSLREAAAVLSISIGSARQHYDRGKKRLREILEQTEVSHVPRWRRTEDPNVIS
jgi:RNA polymerase sigma-70 factor (ECF subfamily)